MRQALFIEWLKSQCNIKSFRNYKSRCLSVERHIGDLDKAYLQDGFEEAIKRLPEYFPKNYSDVKTALKSYKEFCIAHPPRQAPAESFHTLQSVTIRNFKSYKEATLPLGPLTLLIGANASGKSNAVEALRLLRWQYKYASSDFWQRDIDDIRGKKEKFFYDCSQNIVISYNIGDKKNVFYIRKNKDAGCCKDDEISTPTFMAEKITEALQKVITNPLYDKEKIYEAALELIKKENYFSIQFLDTIPARMRDYADRQNDALQADAANLSAVLYRMCQDTARKERLLSFVKSLPEQDIVDIRFVETPRDEVMVQLVENFGGKERTMDADSLSDGTLRVLALAAFLLTAPAGSLLVVEELDNGIHPSRARDLVAQTLDIARQRQVQILLTSHNPALLDALPYDALPDVVCCYRDRTEGDSRLVRLGDLPKYPALMAQGSLGDLVTRQVIDRYLHETRTAEEEKAAALSWLEELRTATERAHE